MEDRPNPLGETDERYRRFVTEDFTGMLVMRTDGQIVTCNPAAAGIFGRRIARNFLPKRLVDILSRDCKEAASLSRPARILRAVLGFQTCSPSRAY